MQLITRALSVLQALSARPDGMGVHDLHEQLEIPLGSIHRILATLSDQGFVSRSPSNPRYFLGPATRRLAEQNLGTSGAAQVLAPTIRTLAAQTGETVFVTEMQGSEALCIFLVDGTYPLRLFVRLGQTMPLNAAAAARVLLAHLNPDAARALLQSHSLQEFRDSTPNTVEQVVERLPRIREQGYDIADDELDAGIWAVAAPIFTSTGLAAASVTLAGAANRLKADAVRQSVVDSVVAAADTMSRELGWVGGTPES